MSKRLRHKGQYVKKINLTKKLNFYASMKEAKCKKAKCSDEEPKPNLVGEGRRIVELLELGKNLKCFECANVLSLENLEGEKCLGLNSILSVRCKDCSCLSEVLTGKMHSKDGHSKLSDVNSKAVLGSLHAGIGHTALSKIFACLNIPHMPHTLFKRYEREVGPAIELAAKESCERAAQDERQLVIENIHKLCDEL